MEEAFKIGLVVLIITAVLDGVPRIIAAKSEALNLNDEFGRISLPRGSALFYIALCLGFLGLGVFAIVADTAMFWVGLAIIAMSSYGVWCTGIASEKRGSVAWCKTGIEGPCRMYPFPFVENRKHVPWECIASFHEGAHGIVILKSKSGEKIVWSSYFAGADFLKDLIQRKCSGEGFK